MRRVDPKLYVTRYNRDGTIAEEKKYKKREKEKLGIDFKRHTRRFKKQRQRKVPKYPKYRRKIIKGGQGEKKKKKGR